MAASIPIDGRRINTATTGTGTITLGAAVTGYPGTTGMTDGATYSYSIVADGSNWEFGNGVYTASGTTLTRNVSSSSNSNTAISLSGSAVVNITWLAADVVAKGRFVLLGKLLSADFNSTADQAITLTQPGTGAWDIAQFTLTNTSTSLTTAKGTFYAAASKTSVILGISGATTGYTGLVTSTDVIRLTGISTNGAASGGTNHFSYQTSAINSTTIYLSLTTPQGGAATADIYVWGYDLS